MNRGRIVILLILTVAVLATGFSLVYHYRHQHRAQQFWGTPTALLIDKGPQVELLLLNEPAGDGGAPSVSEGAEQAEAQAEKAAAEKTQSDGKQAKPEGEQPKADGEAADAKAEPTEEAPAGPRAVEFGDAAWSIAEAKDGAKAKGIANLRRALVLDTTFDWDAPQGAHDPVWQYALAIDDGRNRATVLFDFDSHRAALAGGRKTALLNSEASSEFHKFFTEHFPEREHAEKAAEAKSAATEPAAAAPAETAPEK